MSFVTPDGDYHYPPPARSPLPATGTGTGKVGSWGRLRQGVMVTGPSSNAVVMIIKRSCTESIKKVYQKLFLHFTILTEI